MNTGFWWKNLKLRDLSIDGRIIVRWILRKFYGNVWTGLIWLRIRTSGWLL